MNQNTVITIGRQYGSGGHNIGIRLAKELGIPFYDREFLKQAAEESGLCEDVLRAYDEKPRSFLYSVAMDPFAFSLRSDGTYALEQKIYSATNDALHRLADKGSCVIIGRCADYLLRDCKNLFRVFLYAPLAHRIEVVKQRDNLKESDAKLKIQRTDRGRSSYYDYYTSQKWGSPANYDLCLDTSVFGEEGTVEILRHILDMHF